MVCRDKCILLYPPAKKTWGQSTYEVGNRWCAKCEVFVFSQDKLCPCCNGCLRTNGNRNSR
jgi:hypothetical protein